MITDLERQRVADRQRERERYLRARRQSNQPTLPEGRALLATRYHYLPALLVAPYAILAVAGGLDLLSLVTGNGFWTALSFAMIPAGVIGSVVAVSVATHDWFIAPSGSRVRGVGAWYGIATLLLVTIFAQSWVARFGTDGEVGGVGVILGFVGAAIALLSGLLLGDYLERLSAIRPAPAEHNPVDFESGPRLVDEIVETPRAANA